MAQTQPDGGARRWMIVLVGLGVVSLLAFPVGARLWADALPIAPRTGPALPPLTAGRGGQIHSLPEFVTITPAQVSIVVTGGASSEGAAINRLAVAVFGGRGERLIARAVAIPIGSRLPRLPTVPASRLRQANDLAALLIEAAAISGPATETGAVGRPLDDSHHYANAGTVALALLRAAARTGACAPQLNEAFLLASADGTAMPQMTQRAYGRAVAACPGDPTALWALGEYESIAVGTPVAAGTFATLERKFPRLGAAWSGDGDNHMRIGYALQDDYAPFGARGQYQLALALYRRAEALAPGPGNRSGIARALDALDQDRAAAAVQRQSVVALPDAAPLQARLLDYLQRAHEFSAAVRIATRLASTHQFPVGPALFAEPPPVSDSVTTARVEDADQPLSTGAGTMAPVEVQLQPTIGPCQAYNPVVCAATTSAYLAYLPVYLSMGGIGGLARWCPLWSRRVDLLLSQHAADVLGNPSGALDDLRPGADDCDQFPPGGTLTPFGSPLDGKQLAAVAELNLGKVAAATAIGTADRNGPFSLAYLEELRENLWRYAGDYGLAATAAAQWASLQPHNFQPLVEEGEIAFLRHRYGQAATYFAVAVNRSRFVRGRPTDSQAEALLDQGTALAYAGRRPEALATLATANETAIRAYEADPGYSSGALLAAYADQQVATMLLNANDPDEAAEDFAVAADSARQAGLANAQPAGDDGALNLAVLDNNYAISELALGDPSAAAVLVQTSIDQDPGNAIFWWTEAQAQQQAGDRVAAIAAYRKALARDPTEFPAANNLGVLLLDRGNVSAAVSALRRSVGAAPDYATGWFNLAVALGRQGPLHVLASEGALARAEELNSSLANRAPKPYLDNAVYLSHLDLSKPLPPKWTFASSQSQAPIAAAGLSTILVMTLTLARSLAARAGQGDPKKWLDTFERFERTLDLKVVRGPALAVAATLAFLLWPLHTGPEQGWAFLMPYTVGLAILIAVVFATRQLVARRTHTHMHEETWLPGVGLGLILTIVGFGWTPLPIIRASGKATALHWAAPAALATLALALLLLATWLQVPVTRSLGAAALVMAASLLTPVKPLDGATVSDTSAGALPSIAILGSAILLLIGLL